MLLVGFRINGKEYCAFVRHEDLAEGTVIQIPMVGVLKDGRKELLKEEEIGVTMTVEQGELIAKRFDAAFPEQKAADPALN